ncbi:thiamine diphosphokinase [bacterium]|nr:thiamine diphosphokinase [bacterium]
MRALILCNGERPSAGLLARQLAQTDVVICTDGALEWAVQMGCRPDVVIGDMDSGEPLSDCEVVDCGPHGMQENSDAEKALLLTLEGGAERIVLLGATGQRLDHTLANVWVVARYHDRVQVVLADDWSELFVIHDRYARVATPGEALSLVALTPDVTLDTEGLRWPLHGPLEMGTRGLSNEAVAEEIVVDVHSGLVAVITPAAR